jgi:DNA-binding transcriptional regulator GbsR (MarR family)
MSLAAENAKVRDAVLLAGDAVGDAIEHWGFRKALGRIWTTLYLSSDALTANDLAEELKMSAGAVSMTMAELKRWGVIRRALRPGERREFFEAETDFWKMISRVFRERERSLASSVRDRLVQAAELLEAADSNRDVRETRARLRKLVALSTLGLAVLDTFITSQTADFSSLGTLLSFARPNKNRGSKKS